MVMKIRSPANLIIHSGCCMKLPLRQIKKRRHIVEICEYCTDPAHQSNLWRNMLLKAPHKYILDEKLR